MKRKTVDIAWLIAIIAAVVFLLMTPKCSRATDRDQLIIIGGDAVIYAPDGQRFSVPAGSEFDACTGETPQGGQGPIAMDFAAHVVTIVAPCEQRPVFVDGFE